MIRRNSGYSLLEVLIVLIFIAGAAFLLLIPVTKNLGQRGIEISSVRLLEDLRETQQAAISENVWHRVKFYPFSNDYMVFRQGEFIKAVKLEPGVQFGNYPPELTLLPTGTPVSGMTIVLQSGKFERRVIVAPVMGRIRLEIVR